jgi:hypothetical protein
MVVFALAVGHFFAKEMEKLSKFIETPWQLQRSDAEK